MTASSDCCYAMKWDGNSLAGILPAHALSRRLGQDWQRSIDELE